MSQVRRELGWVGVRQIYPETRGGQKGLVCESQTGPETQREVQRESQPG